MSERTKYLTIFRGEAEEHLTSLRDGLMMLEGSPGDSGLLLRVMRNAHTLKGTSRMMGFHGMGEVAHKMEDVLTEVESNPAVLTEETLSVLLSAVDYIAEVLAAVGAKKKSPPVPADLVANLRSTIERPGRETPARKKGLSSDLGQSLEAILEPAEKPPARAGKSGRTTVVINLDRHLNTIRVDVPVLDRLTDLVGELSINRDKLRNKIFQARQVAHDASALVQAVPRVRKADMILKNSAQNLATRIDEFSKAAVEDLDDMSHLLREILDETLQIRMLPLSLIMDDFYRLVREQALKAGKVVNLEIEVADTKLDKKVLEEIVAPLIHMVTNAVDHGIEVPEDRIKLGKSEAGLIRVRAIAEGDHASIEVYDDGRGLDPNALRTAAVSRAILTEKEAKDLSDEAAYNLIFRSGLSTLERVTGTSGRGVGMDVVRTNVETLKGDVSIQSKLGEFTRFTLSLPVNYAILQALLVDAGNQVSVIPLDFVVETLHLDRERIIRQGGRSRMPYRGGSLLLVELGPFLQFQTETRTDGKRLQVVVLSCRGEQLAVVVDRILRREEVVVKSVGTFLQGMSLVSGATILRMGDPAIILNVFDLIDLSRGREEEIRAPAQPRRAKKLLVVDDSVTSRSVQRGILERAGYSVDVARDGEEGLEMIRSSEYDLVVTDVDMPKRDGFQLTETLQGDPATRNLPVIIVTAKADDSERRRGLEAGARAYITKGAFDQEVLVDTVRRLIG